MISHQIEKRIIELEKEVLPEYFEFVSLFATEKEEFLDYESKVKAGIKVGHKRERSKRIESPVKAKEAEKDIQAIKDSIEEDKEGEIKPKKRGNKTRVDEKWSYKLADQIVRKDEGHMIYYRNDSNHAQKLMNVDSTVVIKSAIESRLRLLSVKQLPEIYELQLFIHDSIVKIDNEGNTILNEFMKNSFPDSVQKLTLYAQLSKTKTEPLDENLITTI